MDCVLRSLSVSCAGCLCGCLIVTFARLGGLAVVYSCCGCVDYGLGCVICWLVLIVLLWWPVIIVWFAVYLLFVACCIAFTFG